MKYTCPQTLNDKWLVEFFFRGINNGFFIEAGGGDGITESASYVLEKYFGWRGIIVEPCDEFYEMILKARDSKCIPAALSNTDGRASFITAKDKFLSGLESNICEWHKENVYQEGHRIQTIETISMRTLLQKNQCPSIIDLIVLDVEGAETLVLQDFPFDKYLVKIFIIEISNNSVKDILYNNGFLEIKNHLNTETPWESYFVNQKIIDTSLGQS